VWPATAAYANAHAAAGAEQLLTAAVRLADVLNPIACRSATRQAGPLVGLLVVRARRVEASGYSTTAPRRLTASGLFAAHALRPSDPRDRATWDAVERENGLLVDVSIPERRDGTPSTLLVSSKRPMKALQ
jgi:hypothetical protein